MYDCYFQALLDFEKEAKSEAKVESSRYERKIDYVIIYQPMA